jgi:Na+/H+ antiporter NhaC
MVRALSLLIVALLVGGVFLLPKADPLRIGADLLQEVVSKRTLLNPADPEARDQLDPQLADWLREHVPSVATQENPVPEPISLLDAWKGTEAYSEVETEDGPVGRLELHGVHALVEGYEVTEDALLLSGRSRDAILRGLRIAGQKSDPIVEIIDSIEPGAGGINVVVTISPDYLRLGWHMADEIPVGQEFPWTPPDRRSLLPPLVAIALALALRKPAISLIVGVVTGAYLLRRGQGDGVFESAFGGTLDVGTKFFAEQFGDLERAQIIGFVICMLAMVGILVRNGGLRGVMNSISRFANSARSTQVVTYLMGLLVFFDDYANTILVGGTMRPLADRFKISREKLAYIVDSTAAPVAGLSIFSTWIAFEVSTFSAQLPLAELSASDGYAVFLETLPYRFYCIFALVFVGLVVFSKRDFGPMWKAEHRAATTGKLVRDGGQPMVGAQATNMQPAPGVTLRAYRAVVPLTAFVGITIFEILRGGGAFAADANVWSIEGMTQVLYDGSGSWPLFAGSFAGLLLAVVFSLEAGLRSEIASAAWKTLRSMGIAIVILYLAWMIGAVCNEMGTAYYLTDTLGDMQFPLLLPVTLFMLSGAVSFSTGSSWGTMSILLPLVVGLSYQLGSQHEIAEGLHFGHGLMILSIGAVLEGSIFGDHCSPISDTTVLSSVAVASDHVDHVRTQAPYALLVMVIAIVAGYFPCAAFSSWNPLYSLLLGGALLFVCLRLLGKPVPSAEPTEDEPDETGAQAVSRTA